MGSNDLASILSHGFLPEFSHGTLAITQPAVDITIIPQGILGSVKSLPLISVGPGPGSNAPEGYGLSTVYFLARGIFHLRATRVTVPGTVTLDLQQQNLGTSNWASFSGSSGITQPTVHVPIDPCQRDFFIPIEAAVAGEPGSARYGCFDVFVSHNGAAAAALQIIAGSLQIMVWPTNTKIASYPQILEFVDSGKESDLIYNANL
jgi:hypothetical protein